MKRIIRNSFFILFAALLLGGLKIQTNACAAVQWRDMCESEVLSKTKIKLHWKPQQKVDGYIIYRSQVIKDEKKTARKKLATLSSETTSFVDKVKYQKRYCYEMVAFTKKGKIKTAKFKDYCYTYAGVAKVLWDEYLSSDAVTTPKSIHLLYGGDSEGLFPEKYEIYRSETNSNYKKIATVKAKENYWASQYIDKKVTSGVSYYYKVRGVKSAGGKKIYGKYSTPILLSAVNSVGTFQMKVMTPNTETTTSLDLMLTSDIGNAVLQLDEKYAWDASFWNNTQNIQLDKYLYSLDGQNWKPFTDGPLVVKPGETFYLRFTDKNDKAFSNPAYDGNYCQLRFYDMTYNRLTCYMILDFKKNTGTVEVNGEYYH